MRRAARVDANHECVVAAYRKLGYLVLSLAPLGRGVPDLLVMRRGKFALVEIKTARGKLRQAQLDFQRAGWPVDLVRSVEDI